MSHPGEDRAEKRKNPSVEHVHHQVRRAILRGDLKPDETLSQVQLAARLGVSRTPLREALRMLQREGLIHGEVNRSVRVAPFSLIDLEQIYAMRLSLEAVALRATLPLMIPENIAELQGHLAQMDHFAMDQDYERWEVPHMAFHQALVGRVGMRFRRTLAELSDHGERYRRFYTVRGPRAWERGRREHRAIFEAVKQRDVEASVAALITHLSHTVFQVITMIDESYDPKLLRGVLTDLLGEKGAAAAWTTVPIDGATAASVGTPSADRP